MTEDERIDAIEEDAAERAEYEREAVTEQQNTQPAPPQGGGGASSPQLVMQATMQDAPKQDLTEQEVRVHALNLAVAGRKDTIRMTLKKDKEAEDPYEDFAGLCIADAVKYEAYLNGEA